MRFARRPSGALFAGAAMLLDLAAQGSARGAPAQRKPDAPPSPQPMPPRPLPGDGGLEEGRCVVGEVPGVVVNGSTRRAFAPPGCATVEVAPPSFGRAALDGLVAGPNVGMCPTLLSAHQRMNDVLARVVEVSRQIDAFLEAFDGLRAEVEVLERALNARDAERTAAQEIFVTITGQKVDLEAARRSADADYEDCVLLEETSCETLESRAVAAARDLAAFVRSSYEPARLRAEQTAEAHRAAYAAYTAKLGELSSALAPVVALQQEIHTIQTSILDAYALYAGLDGAVGTLRYSVPWDLRVGLSPVRVTAASFAATARIGGVGTAAPALRWVELPGLPRTDATDGIALVETNSPEAGSAVMAPGGSVAARVGLTLVGACPYFPTGAATDPGPIDASRFAAHVVANAAYRYEVLVPNPYRRKVVTSPVLPQLTPSRGAVADPVRQARVSGSVLTEALHEARREAFGVRAARYEEREVARKTYEQTALDKAKVAAAFTVARCVEPLRSEEEARGTDGAGARGWNERPVEGCPRPRPLPRPRPAPEEPPPPPPPPPPPAYVPLTIAGGLTFVP